MTTAFMETNASNPCTANHLDLFSSDQSSLECLVIAHNDSRMNKSLSNAFAGIPTAILKVDQSEWDFKATRLWEKIQWSLEEKGVSTIVLVGHSQAAIGVVFSQEEGDFTHTNSTAAGFNRLLESVRKSQRQQQQVKAHFAKKVSQMCEIPKIKQLLTQGKLQVHGLFYISESHLFLAYNMAKNTFQPLGG